MSEGIAHSYYKPVFLQVHVDNHQFGVLDSKVAAARADLLITNARKVLDNCPDPSGQQAGIITRNLLMAMDYGCPEAAYLLAELILKGVVSEQYLPEDAVEFMTLAAEWGHAQACYRLACCYAEQTDEPQLLQAGEHYFAAISANDKALLANFYFAQAAG